MRAYHSACSRSHTPSVSSQSSAAKMSNLLGLLVGRRYVVLGQKLKSGRPERNRECIELGGKIVRNKVKPAGNAYSTRMACNGGNEHCIRQGDEENLRWWWWWWWETSSHPCEPINLLILIWASTLIAPTLLDVRRVDIRPKWRWYKGVAEGQGRVKKRGNNTRCGTWGWTR